MKKYASIFLSIVLCLILTSCSNQQTNAGSSRQTDTVNTGSNQQTDTVNTGDQKLERDKALIGEWSGTLNWSRLGYTFEPAPALGGREVEVTLRFDEDGYCQFASLEYRWSTEGNKLILSSTSLGSPNLTYTISGDKLEITSTQDYSATRTFTRQ